MPAVVESWCFRVFGDLREDVGFGVVGGKVGGGIIG